MRKNIILIIVTLGMLCGCAPGEYQSEQQILNPIAIADDAFFMKGQKLAVIESNGLETFETVFYVENEEELAKVVQYAIENNLKEIAYQSKYSVDIEQVTSLISMLNPFDLSITHATTEYSGVNKELLYVSKHLLIKNLDDLYGEQVIMAENIVKNIVKPAMSRDEKIRAIHNYIIRTTVYDERTARTAIVEGNISDVFQAGGVLFNNTAVCAGYTRAFMMMARAAGIPSLYISSVELNHSWNYVLSDNGWKFIDVTWDDPIPDQGNNVGDKYIDMSKDEFVKNREHKLTQNLVDHYDDIVGDFFGN